MLRSHELLRTRPVVWWLGLRTSSAGDTGSILGRGARSHMLLSAAKKIHFKKRSHERPTPNFFFPIIKADWAPLTWVPFPFFIPALRSSGCRISWPLPSSAQSCWLACLKLSPLQVILSPPCSCLPCAIDSALLHLPQWSCFTPLCLVAVSPSEY